MTQSPSSTSSRDGKAIVSAAWQAFGSRGPERIAAVFTPDAQWLAPPRNATAMAIDGTSHLVGRDRIIRFLATEFQGVFSDVRMEVTGMFADGDTVSTETRFSATLPRGGRYENEYCFIFELRDGLIHRIREYMDTQRGAEWFARDAAVPAPVR